MKAVTLSHFKTKLRDVSRDLFLDHGWDLPDGLASYGNKNPLNFTLEEWQQAKRQSLNPAHRLDPMVSAVIINEADHFLNGRSSSA